MGDQLLQQHQCDHYERTGGGGYDVNGWVSMDIKVSCKSLMFVKSPAARFKFIWAHILYDVTEI